MTDKISINQIDGIACRAPLAGPVRTSFGEMRDRPAVFVRVEADDGAFGWGEVFANWPAAAAEHRVNLIERDIGPLVGGVKFDHPSDLFHHLSRKTHVCALQSGEWGPFRQVIAGLDMAVWDLTARRAGQPLRVHINSAAGADVPAYASAIDCRAANPAISQARNAGYRAFKLKVGFDRDADSRQVRAVAASLNRGERLFADANQAWTVSDTLAFLDELNPEDLDWLEEPIPADSPVDDWQALKQRSTVPLAVGENVAGIDAFQAVIDADYARYLQPDMAKWGGFTGCLMIAQQVSGTGGIYCPHFLGGGIGLAASAELLAAIGGDGLLEVDINPNPLRDAFAVGGLCGATGRWTCAAGPGMGIETLPAEVERLITHRISLRL